MVETGPGVQEAEGTYAGQCEVPGAQRAWVLIVEENIHNPATSITVSMSDYGRKAVNVPLFSARGPLTDVQEL